MKIGPWTLEGTNAQNTILKPMAEKAAKVLALPDGTSRVKDCRVIIKARKDMPWADDDETIKARGYWNGNNIFLADDLFPNPDLARKTFAHELTHQLDDQWMLKVNNEADIKPLFTNPPAGWPGEAFAVYGSAAIFGFTNPPYQNFYKGNRIPVTNWPKVKEYALRDDHVDPCKEWKDQYADALAKYAAAAQENAQQAVLITELTIQLETCKTSLDTAKANAQATVDLPDPKEE